MAVNSLLSRTSLALAPTMYRAITRLLFATCRHEQHGIEHYHSLQASDQPFIVCFWHYSLVMAIHHHSKGNWVAMVSASSDAEYVSRILQSMGFVTVRGSRGKGGLAALKEMMTLIKEQGRKAAIIADGSQGPPLEVQAGVILLASKTGLPILPFAGGADRYWAFRSWDRTVLPKPFARLSSCFGAPMTVPAKIKSQELEYYRLQLETQMLNLYTEAWGIFGIDRHGYMAK
ncbi:MAG: lysophospholipid acyltransferase family protein [Desulfobulbaceae bacterium]|nr:lysophospholipid acyltransferase family protein [Desulfobulbaceae bacterium]